MKNQKRHLDNHLMLERLCKIHAKIKSGCYPNCQQLAYDNEVSIATITEFEKEVEADLAVLNTYKKNLNKVLDERDHVFFYLTVTFGIETYEAYLRWCTDAKKILSGKKIVRSKR